MKKAISIAVIMLFVATATAQEAITINISQDAVRMIGGDRSGNYVLTPNFTLRSEWQGTHYNEKWFPWVGPGFEYRSLDEPFRRYTMNAGATLTLGRTHLGASAGYGITDYKTTHHFFSGSVQLAQRITPRGILFLEYQVSDTPGKADPMTLYIGLKIEIWKKK